jgi:hypothetical protein
MISEDDQRTGKPDEPIESVAYTEKLMLRDLPVKGVAAGIPNGS